VYGKDHYTHIDPQKDASCLHNRQGSTSTTNFFDDADEEDSTLVDGVVYLSLCASSTTHAAPEPFYMGSSSGATITRMIQSSMLRARKSSNMHQPLNTLRSRSTSSTASCGIISLPTNTQTFFEFPPPSQAQRLFSVFFNRLHTRWPILDRNVYEQVFKLQYQQGALPIVEKSSLYLIYAISTRFLQLTKQAADVDPEVRISWHMTGSTDLWGNFQ